MASNKKVETYVSSWSWVCPAWITSVFVEAWWAGWWAAVWRGWWWWAYAADTLTVVPWNSYTITIWLWGLPTADWWDTSFDSSVIADWGKWSAAWGTAGLNSGSTGTIKYSWGAGTTTLWWWSGGDKAQAFSTSGGIRNWSSGGEMPWRIPWAGAGNWAWSLVGAGWLVKINYTTTENVYPSVRDRRRWRFTSWTSLSLLMPTYSVWDILLAIITMDGFPTTSMSWWTLVWEQAHSTAVKQSIYYKVAAWSDTWTLTLSVSEAINYIVFSLENAGIPTGTFADGNSTNAAPPTHNPWVTKNYLWIVTWSWDASTDQTTALNPPSGYTGQLIFPSALNLTWVAMVTAEKTANASSDTPWTFTSSTEQWVASTLSVPYVAPILTNSGNFFMVL